MSLTSVFFGKLIAGIDFLEFWPSEIAAAVAASVLKESQVIEIDKAITDLLVVEKVWCDCSHIEQIVLVELIIGV